MPVENVLEVAELGGLSAVPGAGGAVLGVRNLHGQVLPVFDLARVLAIAGDASTRRASWSPSTRAAWPAWPSTRSPMSVSLSADAEENEAEHLSGAVLEDGLLIGIIDVERLFGSLATATA